MEKQAQEIGQFLHKRGREGEGVWGVGVNGRKHEEGKDWEEKDNVCYVTLVSLLFCFLDTTTCQMVIFH